MSGDPFQVAAEISLKEITPTSQELLKIIEDISGKNVRRPVPVFSADGSMVPIRTEDKTTALLARSKRDTQLLAR
nr:hypothetical protein [uncultured Desulfobulbus sp.]